MIRFYVPPSLYLAAFSLIALWIVLLVLRLFREPIGRRTKAALVLLVAAFNLGAIIQSGASTDLWTIDPTSKAGRITSYDTAGRSLAMQSKETFSFTSAGFTPAATPTDLCVIGGHGSATIRVIRASFGGTATAAANYQILVIKRGAANTAGTFVSGTAIPHDDADATIGGVVGHYTANPTINSTIGTLSRNWIGMAIAGTAGQFFAYNLLPDPGASLLDKPVVLSGTTDQLALNGNSVALPAGAANWWCSFTWMEE